MFWGKNIKNKYSNTITSRILAAPAQVIPIINVKPVEEFDVPGFTAGRVGSSAYMTPEQMASLQSKSEPVFFLDTRGWAA